MKIGEWDDLGRARALLHRQLGELNAAELAAYVSTHPDTGRQRIMVATDIALLDYTWGPMSQQPGAPWILRGQATRWQNVQGLKLASESALDDERGEPRGVWRLFAQEPKIELSAEWRASSGPHELPALLAFARACLERAG
jgi:hypothetical protein